MQHNNFSAAINFQKKRSLLFGFTHWWKFSIVIQKETLLWWRFSGCRHFMEFFRIWKNQIFIEIYWKLYLCHSSEKRGLRSIFCSGETLQNLPYCMYKKTHAVFFRFSFHATLSFILWMPMSTQTRTFLR